MRNGNVKGVFIYVHFFYFLVFILLFSISSTYGQDCGCDYVITPSQEEVWLVNGPSPHNHQKFWPLKRKGETVVCLEAGLRGRLYIRNFNGGVNNDSSKYVFKNCGGIVNIKAPDSDALVFFNCQDIKLTGTGDPANTYGIKISQSRWTGTNYGNGFGISLQGFSEKAEIEFVEITNTGFSAITAKTDGGKYFPDGKEFILRDCSFHDNYIHDLLKGEGFYIGHNSWSVSSKQHNLDGIFIYNNKLENIPWDGIQIGGTRNSKAGTPSNVEIYGNEIINYGTDTNAIDTWQNNGINLSSGFSGRCYGNFIKSGSVTNKGNGIITGGVGDVFIYNNIIANAKENGIYVNNSSAEKGKSFYFFNNTIVKPHNYGIDYRIPDSLSVGYFINNLVSLGKAISLVGNSCRLYTDHNYHEIVNKEGLFVNSDKDDYRLKYPATYLINKGADLSKPPYSLFKDYLGNLRPVNGSYDIGAIEMTKKGKHKGE
jgi:hypothetical protein